MRLCDFDYGGRVVPVRLEYSERFTCRRCGFSLARVIQLPIIRTCDKPGWGDLVARVLWTMGIRKAACSPCQERQEKLNRWGDRVADVGRLTWGWIRRILWRQ